MQPAAIQPRTDPRMFGKRTLQPASRVVALTGRSDDVRLFAWTFAAGFVFMTVFLA